MTRESSGRIVYFKDIGNISFVKRSNSKNLKISIKPFRGIQVSMPFAVTMETAGRFIEAKRSWILRQKAKLAYYENQMTVFNEATVFKTRDHILKILRHDKSTLKTVVKNGIIYIFLPSFADIVDPRIQKFIRRSISETWRIEAKKYLPGMLKDMASRFRFNYGKLNLRNNKTRWGSCSRSNTISLNIHLMQLPRHLQEYVMLHELCHTVHRNHQRTFWQLLDQVSDGKARELDRELNQYSSTFW
jgi:predicted metal-dependent hydrolase